MTIDDLLRAACEARASDLHLKVGSLPAMRVDGELKTLRGLPEITREAMQDMVDGVTNERQRHKFQERGEIDLAYAAGALGRFRANVFQERGETGMVLRVIPAVIRGIDELRLPRIVHKFCEDRRGLVLVTGTTGCGKSTTLAAIIDKINSTRSGHILTIEDPIEFYHRDKKAFVNQREVGVDTLTFDDALRSALRQDPDVLLVGEMRDLETMRTALNAAETGHMVFSTLHTLDAQETVQRIIGVFPPSEQKQIRMQLASTLNGVISQRLVRRADGQGRVPAVEVLVATEFIRECIINSEKTRLIHEILASGTSEYGMQTFDQSLYDLYSNGLITMNEASLWASNAQELKLRAEGIRSASDMAREQMERASILRVERFGGK
ncbi:MAG TPA: type IV pilus twitching motility protein PilT [Terriglobia bacterium]|nr:type IV pilus twitching motility protein PilT [Terriglobia bacterium]